MKFLTCAVTGTTFKEGDKGKIIFLKNQKSNSGESGSFDSTYSAFKPIFSDFSFISTNGNVLFDENDKNFLNFLKFFSFSPKNIFDCLEDQSDFYSHENKWFKLFLPDKNMDFLKQIFSSKELCKEYGVKKEEPDNCHQEYTHQELLDFTFINCESRDDKGRVDDLPYIFLQHNGEHIDEDIYSDYYSPNEHIVIPNYLAKEHNIFMLLTEKQKNAYLFFKDIKCMFIKEDVFNSLIDIPENDIPYFLKEDFILKEKELVQERKKHFDEKLKELENEEEDDELDIPLDVSTKRLSLDLYRMSSYPFEVTNLRYYNFYYQLSRLFEFLGDAEEILLDDTFLESAAKIALLSETLHQLNKIFVPSVLNKYEPDKRQDLSRLSKILNTDIY